jgi:hypothetical protein
MEFSSTDADFSSQSHLTAIMQACACIDQHCRSINGACKAIGDDVVRGDDGFGVA